MFVLFILIFYNFVLKWLNVLKKMKYLYDWDIFVDNLKIYLFYGYCCNKKILVVVCILLYDMCVI